MNKNKLYEMLGRIVMLQDAIFFAHEDGVVGDEFYTEAREILRGMLFQVEELIKGEDKECTK